LGWSTENVWLGPGIRNGLILSDNAPGFPHVFAGTSTPAGIGIGTLEVQAIWGHLRESDYYDTIPANDRRMFAGIVVSFAPSGLPGLYLGGTRVFLRTIPEDGLSIGDYIRPLFESFLKENLATAENPSGTSADNQLASLFARWVMPESGFEAYIEWAREDHSQNFEDFLLEPEHSSAFTLGFQKIVTPGRRTIRIQGELTDLQHFTPPRTARGNVPFYTHGGTVGGYTHRGQVLGAGIGPGSDSQYLAADVLSARGRIGAFVERVRTDEFAYYQRAGFPWMGHDVQLITGVRQLLAWRDLDLNWELSYGKRRNRDFVLEKREGNVRADVEVSWRPQLPLLAR
jgi:hypothetical protein